MSVGKRLKKLRGGMSQTAFAERVSALAKKDGLPPITQQFVAKVEADKVGRSAYYPYFAQALGVDLRWFATGEGSPEPRSLSEIADEENSTQDAKLSDKELEEIGKAWPHMPPEVKKAIRTLVDSGEWQKQKKKRGPKH